jgi:hypothetical protein
MTPIPEYLHRMELAAFEFFKEVCGQYEWITEMYRFKARLVLKELTP